MGSVRAARLAGIAVATNVIETTTSVAVVNTIGSDAPPVPIPFSRCEATELRLLAERPCVFREF
jgi:hypothetical protein